MVERDLPKVDVASSNLVVRSSTEAPSSSSASGFETVAAQPPQPASAWGCDTRARASLRSVAGLAALLLLAGCSSADDGEPSEPSPQAEVAPAPAGGPADEPTVLEAAEAPLEWVDAPGSVTNTVTTNGSWFLTVESTGSAYRLDGPDSSFGTGSDDGTRISNALLTEDWAVVVRQDRADQQPATAEVTDLAAGEQFTLDGSSDVPTTSGGTWSLGGDTLVHETVGPSGASCVATVDLATRESSVGWCAAAKHGFNGARVTPEATTVLSFDDAKPLCRTVGNVVGAEFDPFPGVPECLAWEGALLGADRAVWSVIPDEAEPDAAELFARDDDEYYALGPGTSGTVVPCAGAAYFVRDPQLEGDPARLLRWDGSRLTVAYEAPPGQSFLDAPRCGDDALVVTAHSEGGDEQVMAALD